MTSRQWFGTGARMTTPEEVKFETLLTQLEDLVQQLEHEELPLETALDAYQRGVELARQGHQRLAEAERKLEMLSERGKTTTLSMADEEISE